MQRKELTKLSPYVIYKWPTRKKIQVGGWVGGWVGVFFFFLNPSHHNNDRPNKINTLTQSTPTPSHTTQRAAYLKEAGNAAFKAQDMARAEARYSEALGVLQVGAGLDL